MGNVSMAKMLERFLYCAELRIQYRKPYN